MSSAGWQQVKIRRSWSSTIVLSVVHGRLLGLLVEAHQLGQPLRAVGDRAVAAQAVDRPPPGGRGDPCARVGRHAVAPPGGHGRLEGVLDRVLGELEVADLADQRGQHDRPLLAERVRDGGGDRVGRRRGAAHAGVFGRPSAHSAGGITGRTSIVPLAGAGQAGGDLDRLVEVRALDEVVARQRLLGHRERAVGDLRLAVAHADRGRAVHGAQPLDVEQDPRRAQVAVQLVQHRHLGLALGLLLAGRVHLRLATHQHVLGHRPSDGWVQRYVAARRAIWTATATRSRGRRPARRRPGGAGRRR